MVPPTGSGIEFKASGSESAGTAVEAADGTQDAEYHGFALVLAALNQPVALHPASVALPVGARPGSVAADNLSGRSLPLDGRLLPLAGELPAPVQGGDDEGLLPYLGLQAVAARPVGQAAGDPLASVFGQQLLRAEARNADSGLAGMAGPFVRGPTPAVVTPSAPAGSVLFPQQPGFDQALAQRVLVFVQQGIQDARVRVHPEHLGPIELRIRMEGDGLQVTMVSPHAAVREALESALPRLRESLAEQGLDLGHAEVGSGEREADRQRGDSGAERLSAEQGESGAETDADSSRRSTRLTGGYALIDTFA